MLEFSLEKKKKNVNLKVILCCKIRICDFSLFFVKQTFKWDLMCFIAPNLIFFKVPKYFNVGLHNSYFFKHIIACIDLIISFNNKNLFQKVANQSVNLFKIEYQLRIDIFFDSYLVWGMQLIIFQGSKFVLCAQGTFYLQFIPNLRKIYFVYQKSLKQTFKTSF